MGSGSSTKRISSTKNLAPGMPEEHLTKDTSAECMDQTAAKTEKIVPTVTSTPKENSDANNAEIRNEEKGDFPQGKVEDTPNDASLGIVEVSPNDPVVDIAAEKAKRIKKFSNEVKECLAPARDGIKHIQDCEDFPCDTCLKMIRDMNLLSRKKTIDRRAVFDGLAIDTNYCQMFASTFRRRDKIQLIEEADPSEELTSEARQIFTFCIDLLGSAWNFTDMSDYFCIQMDGDGCLTLLVDWFLHQLEVDKPMNKWVDDMIFDAMNVLDNACRREPSLAPKHHRVVPALEKISESDETLTQTIAFMALAKLVKKEEADKLSTNKTCIVSMLSLLKECLSNSDHKASTKRQASKKNTVTVVSIKATELVRSLEQLAINDNNKRLIAEKGGIPIIGKMLKADCSTREKAFAANAIWRLAFLKENKEKLRKDQGIIYNLTENSQSKDEKLRNACMGALFEIYESRLPEGLTGMKAEHGSPQRAPSDSNKSSGHIMLSYKWEHPSKPVMREFKRQLRKRGYNVWMDEDHMMGDKIGAMAGAVENADMVIACITRGYQDSQDCRTEASYAYECKKKIIPVKVSDDFKATGWLGGITAGKIYYIVQGADYVSKVLPSIIEKEFAVRKEVDQTMTDAHVAPSQEPQPPPPTVESQVPGWDCKQVQDWLVANNVTTRHKALKSLNGTQLLQLKKQLTTVPQAFYQSMKDDLKVPYLDVLSLAGALENLN